MNEGDMAGPSQHRILPPGASYGTRYGSQDDLNSSRLTPPLRPDPSQTSEATRVSPPRRTLPLHSSPPHAFTPSDLPSPPPATAPPPIPLPSARKASLGSASMLESVPEASGSASTSSALEILSVSAPSNTEPVTRRSALPTPPEPPSSLPVRQDSGSTTASASALPLQFSPIPSNLIPSAPSPSTSSGYDRLPAFSPAAAFSPADRGPYPPIASGFSGNHTIPAAGVSTSSTIGGEVLTNTNGKGKAREDEDLARRGSKFYASSVAVAIAGEERDRDSTKRNSAVFSGGMAGVGRNSIIRTPVSPATAPVQAVVAMSSPPSAPPLTLAPLPGQTQLPPHLVPQPDVCVECMMRDRDMADVDVTGDGVWERESDAEFEEAMRSEREAEGSSEGSRESYMPSSSIAPRRRKLGRGQALRMESLKLWTSMVYLATQLHYLEMERHAREQTAVERERVRNSSSTTSSAAAAPTLLGVLGRNRSSTLLPNGLVVENINVDRDEKQARARAKSRSRNSDIDPAVRHSAASHLHPDEGIRQYANGDQPWLASQGRRVSSPALKDSQSAYSAHPRADTPSTMASARSTGMFGLGKFARSSTDLRSIGSPRSLSPGRASLGVDDRRNSMWSRFRNSASQSVYSFAPSGSMMDMHIGLSMDKHAQAAHTLYDTYPSLSDSAVARPPDHTRERALEAQKTVEKKQKKKGIKGFFSKLMPGHDKKRLAASEPTTPRLRMDGDDLDDDYDLAPPPPLSALANEPRYHQRSLSSSSVDSVQQPFTPPLHYSAHGRGASAPMPGYSPSSDSYFRMPMPADRGSVMSYGSGRSFGKPTSPNAPRTSYQLNRPSMDNHDSSPPRQQSLLQARTASPDVLIVEDRDREEEVLRAVVRKEKSLPKLPSEAYHEEEAQSFPPSHPQHSYSHPVYPYGRESQSAYSIRTPSLSPTVSRAYAGGDESEDVGGGKKSKARSKVFSMNFPGFASGHKKRQNGSGDFDEPPTDPVVRSAALAGIQREGALVSVRF